MSNGETFQRRWPQSLRCRRGPRRASGARLCSRRRDHLLRLARFTTPCSGSPANWRGCSSLRRCSTERDSAIFGQDALGVGAMERRGRGDMRPDSFDPWHRASAAHVDSGNRLTLRHRRLLVHVLGELRQPGDHRRPEPQRQLCRDRAKRRSRICDRPAWRRDSRRLDGEASFFAMKRTRPHTLWPTAKIVRTRVPLAGAAGCETSGLTSN